MQGRQELRSIVHSARVSSTNCARYFRINSSCKAPLRQHQPSPNASEGNGDALQPRVLQGLGHGDAELGFGHEHAPDEVPACRREVFGAAVERRRADRMDLLQEPALLDGRGAVGVALAEVRGAGAQGCVQQGPSDQHLVERNAGRPDVHLFVLRCVLQNLRRHVLESACQRCRGLLGQAAPSKVRNLQVATVRQQQVVGLDITVQEAQGMHCLEPQKELASPEDTLCLGEALVCLDVQPAQQVALLAQFEQQKDILVLLDDVQEPQHVVALHRAVVVVDVLEVRSRTHGLNFGVELSLDASEREVWPMHDLHCITSKSPAVLDHVHVCEGAPSNGPLCSQLVLAGPYAGDRGRHADAGTCVHRLRRRAPHGGGRRRALQDHLRLRHWGALRRRRCQVGRHGAPPRLGGDLCLRHGPDHRR
mmetsp:Transcript_10656/g.37326  ORF Transcript_10656/g.37326 Transcript_10656/m.37326 type:complete len:421 (-) Transcript_10656:749-2011(-)